MSLSASLEGMQVPNLPGYRPKPAPIKNHAKHQVWSKANGISYASEVNPNQSLLIKSGGAASIPMDITGKIKNAGSAFIKNCGLVLSFYGYFKEEVFDSQVEKFRVRQCELFFFLEDESISIVERKVENSGVMQGTFAKRHRVVKNVDLESFYALSDITLGGTIMVYGRTLFITDCNASTKKWLIEKEGRQEIDLIPVAGEEDLYTTMRAEFMSRETGRDDTVPHNIMKNPMTVFAEAQLGNTVNNSTRQGFLDYDRKVLRFDCYWDDRGSLYGDVMRFSVVYYLCDDTLEVLTVVGPNSGRDLFKKLVKRGKLAKVRTQIDSPTWHWSDFTIGTVVEIYSKQLVIVGADNQTYEFYKSKGMDLPPRVEPTPVIREVKQRELPPYNGYGTEEDSLTSCIGSLIAKVPFKKLGENKIMRFMAKMITETPEDKGRSFTISYYLIDNTVQIHEPPKRNSGIVGGSFLSRMKLRKQGGETVGQGDFYVGGEIVLVGQGFLLVDSEEGTIKHMEQNPQLFEHSDIEKVVSVYAGYLLPFVQSGTLLADFQSGDFENTGFVSIKVVKSILMKYKCSYYYGGPPEQAVITLGRAFGNKTLGLEYGKFISWIGNVVVGVEEVPQEEEGEGDWAGTEEKE